MNFEILPEKLLKEADELLNKILETQGIVDTKATLTVIPKKIASQLGLKNDRK